MSTASKLTYLNGTKQAIKQAINEDFEVIGDNTTFREYADEISSNNAKYKDLIPKETTNATNTLDISNSSGLDKALVTQYGNTKQSILPSEYTQVDYIQSSGSQYIDTGINADTNLRVIVDMAYINYSLANQTIGAIKIGTPNSRYHLLTGASNINFWVNDNIYILGTADNNRHLIDMDVPNGQALYDDTIITTPTNIRDTELSFWLFGRNSTGTKYFAQMKLWNCKMYYNGNLVRDFIPCYRNSDNEVGLYDLVNNVFYINNGTGVFTYESKIPNPDYPQEIVNISGKSTLKDVGKNLLPYPYTQASSTMYGVTFTVQNDGSVLVNGTANGGNANIKLYGNYSEANNKELMGRYVSGGTNEVRLRVLNNTNNSYTLLANDTGNGAEINTSTYKKGYIELTVLNGTTVNNQIIKPMVLDSLDDTTYEAYKEQSFDIDLPSGVELCKIDTYKDRIYPLNGKWYLENFSEKVTIDGTNIAVTNRRETNTSGNYSFIFLFSKKAKRIDGTTTQGGYCDKLVSKPRNNIYGRTQGFGYGATNNDYWGDIVIFRTDWATKTITDVNTDLKSNPIELEYLLDSAETIEITENNYPTLYNQLNNIKLFEGVNHLTFTNESGLDVEFDIEYYKDWKLD